MSNIVPFSLAASSLFFKENSLPDLSFVEELSKNGIFIGQTSEGSVPFFIDFSKLMNPHVFVCGMTGSGKTYFMKSLMAKIVSMLDVQAVVIDFTGEYADYCSYFDSQLIMYFDLSKMPEQEKVEGATKIMEAMETSMRKAGIGGLRKFIFLDEAWKLLKGSKGFEAMLREGRKYGVGLVLSSQLLEDLDASLLDNISSIVVFRLQNIKVLGRLSSNYGLKKDVIREIQDLRQGSAIVIQVYKSTKPFAIHVSHIEGVEIGTFVRLRLGGKMYLEISLSKFESVLGRIYGERSASIVEKVQAAKAIGIVELLSGLMSLEEDREKALNALRELGVSDEDIADAFAYFLAKASGGNGKER